jgi:hypothetical protein
MGFVSENDVPRLPARALWHVAHHFVIGEYSCLCYETDAVLRSEEVADISNDACHQHCNIPLPLVAVSSVGSLQPGVDGH